MGKSRHGGPWLFIANRLGLSGLRLVIDPKGTPRLQPVWKNHHGGTSPIVANGVLFYAGSGNIRALNPSDGQPLWRDSRIGRIHWESPVIADGKLYITDEIGDLTAYAMAGVRRRGAEGNASGRRPSLLVN
ncbi:MAG: PQQ-binding-like beta-propeller repeat protein [Syntrophobacteraceae bacterium]|nr:PQQ-binding-like beta-propeller repeat protein [Syntrophobacteraceae bacterium]